MKKYMLFAAAAVVGLAIYLHGQSYGALGIGPIAPTVASCPAAQATQATLCAVGSGTSFTMYVAYNGGAYAPLTGATTISGTAPIVVNGSTVSCPTCVTGNVVNSFQGRTGNVNLTKADVTGTGLAATTTATTTLQ